MPASEEGKLYLAVHQRQKLSPISLLVLTATTLYTTNFTFPTIEVVIHSWVYDPASKDEKIWAEGGVNFSVPQPKVFTLIKSGKTGRKLKQHVAFSNYSVRHSPSKVAQPCGQSR